MSEAPEVLPRVQGNSKNKKTQQEQLSEATRPLEIIHLCSPRRRRSWHYPSMSEGTASSQQILKFGGVFDLGSRPRSILQAKVVFAFDKVEAVAQLWFGIHAAFQRLTLAIEADIPRVIVNRLDNSVVVLTETLFKQTQLLPAVELQRAK